MQVAVNHVFVERRCKSLRRSISSAHSSELQSSIARLKTGYPNGKEIMVTRRTLSSSAAVRNGESSLVRLSDDQS